jgi:glyoxylase-like metal-dependent hydrolase (beta-lactamase superfamily II)
MPQIGPYSLHALRVGTFGLDGGAMFGIVPKPLWSQRLAPDDQNRIPLAARCLLLDGPDRLILIDTGLGDTFAGTKYEDIYAVERTDGGLEQQLDALGAGREAVTDVVLTHLHFDHCGGSTRQAGGEPTVTFPNATYHVQKAHWNWAREKNPKEKHSFLDRTVVPLQKSGQLHLVSGKATLFPGVTVEPVNGHTEAQQIVTVADGDTTLVYVADLLPTTHHLAPAWTMAYDVRPLVTIEEKRDFLERAADAEWNLFFEHDPNVAVANVERTDRGFQVVRARTLREL